MFHDRSSSFICYTEFWLSIVSLDSPLGISGGDARHRHSARTLDMPLLGGDDVRETLHGEKQPDVSTCSSYPPKKSYSSERIGLHFLTQFFGAKLPCLRPSADV